MHISKIWKSYLIRASFVLSTAQILSYFVMMQPYVTNNVAQSVFAEWCRVWPRTQLFKHSRVWGKMSQFRQAILSHAQSTLKWESSSFNDVVVHIWFSMQNEVLNHASRTKICTFVFHNRRITMQLKIKNKKSFNCLDTYLYTDY